MNRSSALAFALALTFSAAERGQSTTPPEALPLEPAEAASPVDPELKAWLERHVEQPSPFGLSPDKFAELMRREDAATKIYLGLSYANRHDDKNGQKLAVETALKRLEGEAQSVAGHPLLPFIWYEMLKAKEYLAPESRQKILSLLMVQGAGSCAHKKHTFDDINKENLASLSDEGLRELMQRIDGYRSQQYRRNAVKKLVELIPDARRSVVQDKIVVMTEPYPALVRATPWLKELHGGFEQSSLTKDPSKEVLKVFEEARRLSGKRQCSKAKSLVLDGLKVAKSKKLTSTLDGAVNASKAVDGCYRKRDAGLRRDLWKQMTEKLESTYGIPGWAEAKIRLAHIYWSANDFAEATALLDEVIKRTSGEAAKSFEARAIFAQARIAENQGDADKATQRFKEYVDRFSDHENLEEALMSLALLYLERKDFQGALLVLEPYITKETELEVDRRSVGGLSFALFWSGRVYLELGNRSLGAEMWRRVASEFYSTYYGALGHYMLEQISGKKLALQPSRAPQFRISTLREAFLPQDQLRVARVEQLMRLGEHGDAVCELEEIDTVDGKPEKLLLRAVMLFAAGRWLDAIKAYDALPRGFRARLPIGFERMLFPRRFADEIADYAKRANVDSDLVMALIRQESVFNPEARSPVGAMGLMQLMPATARLEVKRINAPYLSAEEKTTIRNKVQRSPQSLLGANTNLAIGVHHLKSLLDKYGSPVYVLSAYNASPGAARRWMNTISSSDVLSFIERIPYKETRAYVKLVLRNYFYYKRWYGTSMEPLPHLDTVASKLIALAQGGEAGPSANAAAVPVAQDGEEPETVKAVTAVGEEQNDAVTPVNAEDEGGGDDEPQDKETSASPAD